MARLVTTIVDARGWLAVQRIGDMVTVECAEPATAYVVRSDGRTERCLVHRVCLHPDRGGASRDEALDATEQIVRSLLGWEHENSLVCPVAGDVRRAGLALPVGAGRRCFALSLASGPAAPHLTSGWGPACVTEPHARQGGLRLDLVVVLDEPPRDEASDLLAGIGRRARATVAEGHPALNDRLSMLLLHPAHRPVGRWHDDGADDTQLAPVMRAVRDATVDALAAAGWRAGAHSPAAW